MLRLLLSVPCLLWFLGSVLFAESHDVVEPNPGPYRKEAASSIPGVKRGQNERIRWFLPRLFSAEKKSDVIARYEKIEALRLTKTYRQEDAVLVMGGSHTVVDDLPLGKVAGTSGAGPCIGVIVWVKNKNELGKAYVFHFGAIDNPAKTLAAVGPFPRGAHVAIFGGENTPESDNTLESVLSYFEKNGSPKGKDPNKALIIDGYSDTDGLWINAKGEYVLFPLDKTSKNVVE